MENPFMFVINYLSLNTKSGYKNFRSLSFLIERALSFAFLLILITPQALNVLWIMEALFNSLPFQASNWLVGVKFSLKYNVFTGLKPNLLLSNLCKSIFFIKSLITKFSVNKSDGCIFRICLAKYMTIFYVWTLYSNTEATKNVYYFSFWFIISNICRYTLNFEVVSPIVLI